jgi:hypothetical protein
MDAQPANTRLIDHFKRVYTIIVGLAITEGCKHLWPLDQSSIFDPNIWMFLAFFVTVIPIFHGGDRALDVKYSEIGKDNYTKIKYMIEVHLLLFMALGFVLVAEAIPQSTTAPAAKKAGEIIANKAYAPFFFLFGATLIFDVAVLSYGWLTSPRKDEDRNSLKPYLFWIGINGALSITALLMGAGLNIWQPTLLYGRFDTLAFLMALFLFGASVLRTCYDYAKAQVFLFPDAVPQPQAATPQP